MLNNLNSYKKIFKYLLSFGAKESNKENMSAEIASGDLRGRAGKAHYSFALPRVRPSISVLSEIAVFINSFYSKPPSY